MDKRNFAFDRVNYILLAVGMAVVIIGFILMSGDGSTEAAYKFSESRKSNGDEVERYL